MKKVPMGNFETLLAQLPPPQPLAEPRTKTEAIQYLTNSAGLLQWLGYTTGAEQIERAIAWMQKQP